VSDKKERSSSHSTMIGYTVEAMYDSNHPQIVAGQLLDNRWREVQFDDKSPIGVPTTNWFTRDIRKHGLYSYEAAQALRWWFHAAGNSESMCMCLKTRLVEHKVVTDTKVIILEPLEEHSELIFRQRLSPPPSAPGKEEK
jgi:hypothetical protein